MASPGFASSEKVTRYEKMHMLAIQRLKHSKCYKRKRFFNGTVQNNLLIFGVFQVCMKVCKIQSKFVEVEVVVVHVNVKICTVASFAIVIAWLGYYHYFLSLSIMSAVKYRGCKDNVPLC